MVFCSYKDEAGGFFSPLDSIPGALGGYGFWPGR